MRRRMNVVVAVAGWTLIGSVRLQMGPSAEAAPGQSELAVSTDASTPTKAKPDPVKADEAPPQELTPEQKAALAEGQALYRGLCSGCHGGQGRGGKGPNLTDDRWLHGGKD